MFVTDGKKRSGIHDVRIAAKVKANRLRFARGEATISLEEMLEQAKGEVVGKMPEAHTGKVVGKSGDLGELGETGLKAGRVFER